MATDAENMLVTRWGLERLPSAVKLHEALAISLGIGAMFDESIEAERHWLNLPCDKWGGLTALEMLNKGRVRHVIDRLNFERGL
jgi:hypothetical protein